MRVNGISASVCMCLEERKNGIKVHTCKPPETPEWKPVNWNCVLIAIYTEQIRVIIEKFNYVHFFGIGTLFLSLSLYLLWFFLYVRAFQFCFMHFISCGNFQRPLQFSLSSVIRLHIMKRKIYMSVTGTKVDRIKTVCWHVHPFRVQIALWWIQLVKYISRDREEQQQQQKLCVFLNPISFHSHAHYFFLSVTLSPLCLSLENHNVLVTHFKIFRNLFWMCHFLMDLYLHTTNSQST